MKTRTASGILGRLYPGSAWHGFRYGPGMSMRTLLFPMLSIALAGGKADAPRPLAPSARAEVLKALAEGRKLAQAKDFRGALGRFDHALSLDPHDARALAEAGWAAFNLQDYERAEETNRRALAAA